MHASGTRLMSDLLHEKARVHPDKACIVFEDAQGVVTELGYGEVASRVDRVCNALLESGIRTGDKIALMMGNCTEFVVCWFAINQAGAVMVPVNVLYAPDELAYLLQTAHCVGFMAEERYVPAFMEVAHAAADVRVRVCARGTGTPTGFMHYDEILRTASTGHRRVAVQPQDASEIIFTSGTTSRPKGAVISHQASLLQGIAVSQALGMRPDDRSAVVLPLFHVNGQHVSVVPTLTVGATIVLLETYSATKYWDQVRRHRSTMISIVTMLLRTMLAQPERDDDARHEVRSVFFALPTTDDEYRRFEQRFGLTLLEGYGLSETLGLCTSNPLYGTIKPHCIGLPMPGREIRIVDEAGSDCAPGAVGRILVRGEPLFSGYYENEEATRACMAGGWFDTGDNGSFDEDGYVYFFDRGKDVIKRAGENIAATEVERVLNAHPAIAESAVIAVPDPLRDEAVKACVVLRPGEQLTPQQVQEWCARHLARFKVPTEVEFLDALPKTSVGKIMKYMLKRKPAHA